MSYTPLVSFIIVNYNTGKLLKRAIESVMNHNGVEVIVADNASNDDSFTKLTESLQRANIIYIENKKNLGFGQAVGNAVKESRGTYIFLLNPDAALAGGALDQMVKTAEIYDNRAIIAPALAGDDGTVQASCYYQQTVWNAVKEYWLGITGAYSKYVPSGDAPQAVHTAVAAAWLMPRTVWDSLGGFSSKFFLYYEDLDFCDRASLANIPVIYDPQAVVTHTHGKSGESNPQTAELFLHAARAYHGWFKKGLIDLIIRAGNIFMPPVSLKKISLMLLAYIVGVLAIASLGYFLLPARYAPTDLIHKFYHTNFILWSWANFDGEHYLGIAQHGYQIIRGQSEYAFFPLFPLLVNLLSRTGLDPYLAARMITTGASVGFMFFLCKWAARYLRNPTKLLWIILFSPGTIFLSAVYTEPLFLCLTILTFYFADKGEWGKASLMTALATATRVNGIFLVVFLLFKLLKSSQLTRGVIYLALSLSGLCAYTLYLWQKTGDPLAWYHAQADWQKADATAPWVTATNYLRAITTEFHPDLTHLVVVIEVIVTLMLLSLLFYFFRQKKLDTAYKAYVLGSLALPLATGSLGSMPRFSLTLFPLFLMIPTLPQGIRRTYYLLFSIMAIVGIILFTRGYWYA